MFGFCISQDQKKLAVLTQEELICFEDDSSGWEKNYQRKWSHRFEDTPMLITDDNLDHLLVITDEVQLKYFDFNLQKQLWSIYGGDDYDGATYCRVDNNSDVVCGLIEGSSGENKIAMYSAYAGCSVAMAIVPMIYHILADPFLFASIILFSSGISV